MPAFQPYWGKPAVRNDREDRGNVGIIRPIRASIPPDHTVPALIRPAIVCARLSDCFHTQHRLELTLFGLSRRLPRGRGACI
jgi:hypothetical protein